MVVGGRDKSVHGIERQTGKKSWTFPTRAKVDSSPVIVGNRVFIGCHDGNLYELGLTDGKERWKFNAGKPISAAPAVGEGVLVIGSESINAAFIPIRGGSVADFVAGLIARSHVGLSVARFTQDGIQGGIEDLIILMILGIDPEYAKADRKCSK